MDHVRISQPVRSEPDRSASTLGTLQKVYTEPDEQDEICHSLQESTVVHEARIEGHHNSQGPLFRTVPVVETLDQKRRDAASDFESYLAKLQANATFGETMEQVRNRVNIRLIADPDTALKAVSKVTFRQSEIINPDSVSYTHLTLPTKRIV